MIRMPTLLFTAGCLAFLLAALPSHAEEKLLGFGSEASAAQLELERAFDEDLNAEEMLTWLRDMSRDPHHTGSEAGFAVGDYIAERLRSWGYEVEMPEYEILLPTPKIRELELTAPTKYVAGLTEETLAEDASTARRDNLLPPYHAFSRDGEVEAELVYVNYGIPEDYEVLERYGIDVAGKIVIAKYGRSWRGIKPKLAGEKGAIGAIVYSDPAP